MYVARVALFVLPAFVCALTLLMRIAPCMCIASSMGVVLVCALFLVCVFLCTMYCHCNTCFLCLCIVFVCVLLFFVMCIVLVMRYDFVMCFALKCGFGFCTTVLHKLTHDGVFALPAVVCALALCDVYCFLYAYSFRLSIVSGLCTSLCCVLSL